MIIGYVRVSTDEQARGQSPEHQRQRLIEKGVPPENIFIDDGYSGNNLNRPAWLRIRSLLESGTVKTLVAVDLSRLHRNTLHALEFAKEFIVERGINLVLLQENVDLSNAAGKMQYTVMCAAHQFMRDQTSDKVKAVIEIRRAKGLSVGGYPPYGYRIAVTGKVVPDEHEQEVLAVMQALRAAGASYEDIRQELHSRGIKTKRGKGSWSKMTVKRILDEQKARVSVPQM